jgi:hypothetical protein
VPETAALCFPSPNKKGKKERWRNQIQAGFNVTKTVITIMENNLVV